MEHLIAKIENNTAKIGIIGMGYVGLPLAMLFARKFHVIGYDTNVNTIKSLCNGVSHIQDVKDLVLNKHLNTEFYPTDDYTKIKNCDFIVICVPTPLNEYKEPDLSYVKSATETVAKILKRGHFVIIESTTYPGTTEEIVKPILKSGGLDAGVDFGIAYSPERVDPGSSYDLKNITKIVGGINDACTDITARLYETVIDAGVVKVRNCKTAEAAKIFENIFRDVNIALVNEFAVICERMGINVWDVIDAAATKPFGFMPFYPGPGVGGHCIPLDPYYFSYAAKKIGMIPRFIEMSGEINEFMKMHTVNLIESALKKVNKKIPGAIITVVGLSYKKDINDVRESPSKKIIEEISDRGGYVKVYDPYVNSINTCYGTYTSEKSIEDALHNVDCVVFVTDHTVFKTIDLDEITSLMKFPIIIDCRNIFDVTNQKSKNIYYGIGKENNV